MMGGETNSKMVLSNIYPKLAAGPVAKQIHSIYADRLRQFTSDGQYREQGLLPYVFLPSYLRACLLCEDLAGHVHVP